MGIRRAHPATRGVKAVPCGEDHPTARPHRGVCARCARRERRRRGTLCNTCVRSVAPGAGAGQATPPPAPPPPPHTWRSGALPPRPHSRHGSRAPRRRDGSSGWLECATHAQPAYFGRRRCELCASVSHSTRLGRSGGRGAGGKGAETVKSCQRCSAGAAPLWRRRTGRRVRV